MASLFNIGVNGLQAQQAALSVTGQNITNASTPGYTRQRVDLGSLAGSATEGLFAGAGARVEQITRIADLYIANQIRTDQALYSEMDSFANRVRQLEGAIFDDGFGIDSALKDFFNAVQNAANDPTDTAMRQFVLSSGEALAHRITGVSERITQQQQDTLASLTATTRQVNELAELIGAVNDRIAGLQDARDTGALNTMLDKRDQLLLELSKLVSVNTSEQADGQINVFIGKGQSLVLGSGTSVLDVTVDGGVTLRPVGSETRQVVTSAISGGELGGLLSYRETVLTQAQNELGRLAASVTRAFNQQHKLGLDLNGNFGGDFFRDFNDPSLVGRRVSSFAASGVAANAGTGAINVHIEDPFAGVASNYELRIAEDGSFTVQRSVDGELVYQGAAITPPQSVEFDGLRIEFTSGTFLPGDALLLTPYADIGNNMDVAVTDPSSVALASPVTIDAAATNQGSATMRVGAITDPSKEIFADREQLLPPLLVRFVSATEYVVLDNSDPTEPRPLAPDLGVQTHLPGRATHVVPHRPGASIVSSTGVGVNALPLAADLVNDLDPGANGYPAGDLALDYFDPAGTTLLDQRAVGVGADASAREIAEALNTMPGIHASAQTEMTLTNLVNYESGTPVEIAVNGTLFSGFKDLNELADMISADTDLAAAGISARSNGTELVLTSIVGDDLTLHFQGDPNESVTVRNAAGDSLLLNGNQPGAYRRVTVGGSVASVLEPNVRMSTQLAGIFAANPEHVDADFGFDLLLSGPAAAGDEFSIRLNTDGVSDNRNGVALVGLRDAPLVGDPPASFAGLYAGLVQEVGVQASQANVNREAAAALLEQSESFRESISGVNLDEEAANLIRFEQAYNASAQVIAVARDIFNVLLNSVA